MLEEIGKESPRWLIVYINDFLRTADTKELAKKMQSDPCASGIHSQLQEIGVRTPQLIHFIVESACDD